MLVCNPPGEAPQGGSSSPHNDLARSNVVEQLERLRTYPSVQRALAVGQLRLYGWFFDLKRAKVPVWDQGAGRFVDAGAQAQTLEPVARVSA